MLAISEVVGRGIIGTIDSLAALRAPTFLPAFLFEAQWLIWIVVALFAAATLCLRKRQGVKIAAVTLILVGAWIILLFTFVTPVERWIVASLFAAVASYLLARQNIKVAVVTLILIGAWVILDFTFITPKERLKSAHQAIVSAANAGDASEIVKFVADDFSFGGMDKAAFRDGLRIVLGTLKFKSNRVWSYEATVRGDLGDSQVKILTEMAPNSAAPGPYVSNWTLDWRDEPGADWRLVRVRKWILNNQEMPLDFSFKGL